MLIIEKGEKEGKAIFDKVENSIQHNYQPVHIPTMKDYNKLVDNIGRCKTSEDLELAHMKYRGENNPEKKAALEAMARAKDKFGYNDKYIRK